MKLDRGLEHFQRRGIGRGLGAAGLAVDALHFRYRLDQPIRALQQLGGLARGQPRQGGGHVEQIAFVQRRQELAAELLQWPRTGQQHDDCCGECCFRKAQHEIEQRTIECNQSAIEWIRVFRRNPAADQIAHQHGNKRHRQSGGGRHRVSLGKRQGREQTSFLRLQREHGDERQRDDEQREKQSRAHFHGGSADHAPAHFVFQLLARMFLCPAFEMLVRVFDHHHRRIDHGADGDGDTAQRHDVGIDALVTHHDEGHQDAQRQRDDGDQRGAQMEQKERADQRNDDELLDEFVAEIIDGAFDQARAVVDRHDLDA